MIQEQSSTLVSFLGALQASLAVLLTISYGLVAARWKLINDKTARDISKTCIRLFLPALLITNVGSQLHYDTASKYIPILLWALTYTLLCMALGWTLKRIFKFPAWTVPAICFNNTTALPLLLVQSLDSAGILDQLLMSDSDTASEAVKRAKSYFLVSAVVGNALTFATGPRLLDDEETPDKADGEDKGSGNGTAQDAENRVRDEEEGQDEETASVREAREATEETTLLPRRIEEPVLATTSRLQSYSKAAWNTLPSWLQKALTYITPLFNAPLIGAAIGAFLGLIPQLHTAFFSPPDEGGFFKAWLTTSIENIGDLFATLQLVVVGSKLATSLVDIKRGKESGTLPWAPLATIFLIRFLLMPALSIPVIYLLAKHNLIGSDPVLWFCMMLIPTGPPATKLSALAEVAGADEDQKRAIAKVLTVSYVASPLICLAVVGSLKACAAVR